MQSSWWRLVLGAQVGVVAACGGTAPPSRAPVVETDAVPQSSDSQASLVEHAPVHAPKRLLLEGRAANPQALSHGLGPFLALRVAQGAGPLAYGALTEQLDESAPVDVVVVLEGVSLRLQPEIWTFVSSGLSSYDEAVTELERLGEVDSSGRRGGYDYDGPGGPCSLLRVAGGARLVCVSANEAGATFAGSELDRRWLRTAREKLERVAPYMVERLANEPVEPGHSWLRAPVGGLAQRYAGLLKAAKPWLLAGVERGGGAEARWLGAFAEPAFDEALALGYGTRELTLRSGPAGDGYRIRAEALFSEHEAWTPSLLVDMAKQAGIPEAFRRLPADAGFAVFTSRVPGPRARQMHGTLKQLIGRATGATPLAVDVMASVVGLDDAMAYAHGDAFGRDAGDSIQGGERLRHVMLSVWGWHLFGFHGPASSYEPRLDAGRRAYNSGDLRDLVYRQLPRLCRGLPAITKRAAGGKLPVGSVLYEMAIPPRLFDDCWREHHGVNPTPAKGASLVVLMVPDGERTWIGVSPDEAGIRERIRNAIAGGPKTLGDVLGAAGEGQIAGGFVTARGLAGMHRFVDQYEHWGTRRQHFDGLPHKGTAPITFGLRVASKQPLRIEAEAMFSHDALEDLSAGSSMGIAFP